MPGNKGQSQLLSAPKVAVFDMDGTLIEQESLVVLAKIAGLEEEVSRLTTLAMQGELGFREAVAERVRLLGSKLHMDLIEKAVSQCSYRNGALEFIAWLKKIDCKTILNTGGFDWLAKRLAEDLGFDACYCNEMIWQDGKVVGVEMTNLIDGEQKASNLTKYCLANGIDLSDAVCFGDGANDIPMMKVVQKAGGVAFAVSAKKVVQEQADHQLNDFSNIIELFEQQTR